MDYYYNDDQSFMSGALQRVTNEDVLRRDITSMAVADVLARSSDRRRSEITINGVAQKETLREKIRRETAELEDTLIAVSGKLADRRRQLKHLERFPDEDPFADDVTIMFDKTFPHDDKKYSYAAVRRDGLWYVTGSRSPNGVTWSDLVNWMGLGVDKVYRLGTGKHARVKVIG